MRKIGQERQGQQPAERNSRATNSISHTTTPPYNGFGGHGRSAQPPHPSMMSILNHPAQATNQFAVATTSSSSGRQYFPPHSQGFIQGQYLMSSPSTPNQNYHVSPHEYHRNASASSSSMSRSSNTPQATNQFAVATTTSSPRSQYLPPHSQGFIQGQYSMTSPSTPNQNYHVSTHEYHRNASASSSSMSRSFNTPQATNQFAVATTTSGSRSQYLPLHSQEFIQEQYSMSSPSTPPGVPAVGSSHYFSSFYQPQVEYQNSHAFHYESCQDSTINYPLPAPGLRSQPNLPNYHSQFPAQVHQDQPHGDGPYQSSFHDPSTPTREEHSFSCGWVDRKNGPCGFKGSRDAFKAHFLNIHLTGPQDGQIVCLWKGCSYIKRGKPEVHTMRRDSAWRHTREIHLGDKYRRVQAI